MKFNRFHTVLTLINIGISAGKKFFFIFLGFFMMGSFIPASAQKNYEAETGIGYYELVHAGIAWSYSAKSSVGLYAGTNFHAQGIKRNSIGLSFTHIYVKPLVWKFRPGFSVKTQYWNQNDDNYYFNNISFLFQGLLSYPVTNDLRLIVEGGGVFNIALETERKQNITVGYPTRWNGNVAFSVRYRINKKTKP